MFSKFFFFKQKTAYEILASDWSSDVCSSDLLFFEGEKKNHGKSPLLIFYPGALVEPESYSIWAQDLAKIGRASCRERV